MHRTARGVPVLGRVDPLAPPPAERARSIVDRSGPITVAVANRHGGADSMSLPHPPRHVDEDGVLSLFVPDEHSLVTLLRGTATGQVDAAVEFVDIAPTDLREPVRGLAWVHGTARLLGHEDARAAAVAMAAGKPDERLLDVGHGLSGVSVDPVFVAIADCDGQHGVERSAFLTAHPDPLIDWERTWLRHLNEHHQDILVQLAAGLAQPVPPGPIRAVGIDRYGLRLRIESRHISRELRIPFRRLAETPAAACAEVSWLTDFQHSKGVRS